MLKIKGLDDVKRKLDKLSREAPKQAKQALKVEAELIMTRSKKEFVPVDLGTLRASGTVGAPVEKNGDITVELSYGGEADAYATAIHEHPSDATPPSWEGKTITFTKPGTGHKYLERPLNEEAPKVPERVAEHLRKWLKGQVNETALTDIAKDIT